MGGGQRLTGGICVVGSSSAATPLQFVEQAFDTGGKVGLGPLIVRKKPPDGPVAGMFKSWCSGCFVEGDHDIRMGKILRHEHAGLFGKRINAITLQFRGELWVDMINDRHASRPCMHRYVALRGPLLQHLTGDRAFNRSGGADEQNIGYGARDRGVRPARQPTNRKGRHKTTPVYPASVGERERRTGHAVGIASVPVHRQSHFAVRRG